MTLRRMPRLKGLDLEEACQGDQANVDRSSLWALHARSDRHDRALSPTDPGLGHPRDGFGRQPLVVDKVPVTQADDPICA